MKLKIKRKQAELIAEPFNPPLQIPEGVINVYETLKNGFVGEIRSRKNSSITQVIYGGMVIIHLEDGSKIAMTQENFDRLFDVIEEVKN